MLHKKKFYIPQKELDILELVRAYKNGAVTKSFLEKYCYFKDWDLTICKNGDVMVKMKDDR